MSENETKVAYVVLEDTTKWITYQLNDPIYDKKGYFTGTYDKSKALRVTIVKHPLFTDHG